MSIETNKIDKNFFNSTPLKEKILSRLDTLGETITDIALVALAAVAFSIRCAISISLAIISMAIVVPFVLLAGLFGQVEIVRVENRNEQKQWAQIEKDEKERDKLWLSPTGKRILEEGRIKDRCVGIGSKPIR